MPVCGVALSLTYVWRGVGRAIGSSFLICSCGSGNFSEESGYLEQPVIHGDPSLADQNAVVVVRNTRTGYWTTGSLVAPRLVLTSKRLLFELTRERAMSFYCNNDSSGTPSLRVLEAGDFEVLFGETFPMRSGNGVRIYASGVLDLCRSDVALLQIDTEFPIAPLALRLDSLPSAGEEGVLIGWGMSNESTQIPPGSSVTHMVRHQAKLRIETIGPTVFPIADGGTLGVLESTFVTAEGGCFGDAGAPFLSGKTQAIVGTLSVLEPENTTEADALNPFHCFRGYTTFRSLVPEREWMLEAFREAGSTAWLEGKAMPADVGSSCGSDEECASGHCLMARSGGFCSIPCGDASCEQGQLCLVIDEGEWCVPMPRSFVRNLAG